MICVRASHDHLDIEGSSEDLRDLSDKVIAFAGEVSEIELAIVCDSSLSAASYDRCLHILRVRHGRGENLFRVQGDTLMLEGHPDNLINFARNLPCDARDPESGISYHVHYDALTNPVDVQSPAEITLTKRRGFP